MNLCMNLPFLFFLGAGKQVRKHWQTCSARHCTKPCDRRTQYTATVLQSGITHPRDILTNPIETPWLTSREAASYLRVEHRTLLAWARQKKVKGYALSGTRRHVWRFLRADLDVMLTGPAVLSTMGGLNERTA